MTNFCLYLMSWFLLLDKTLTDPTPMGLSSVAIASSPTAPQIAVTEAASTTSNNKTITLPKFKSNVTSGDNYDEISDDGWEYENTSFVDTRRILYSSTVPKGKRPYMVYLSLTKESAKAHKYRGWLCGGVIVDKYYVLTSAACVEDADRFYIVSGTTKFVDSFDYKNDDCVCKHRRRVVWKCIPKNYKFDFQDSIKWSSNDIAIVKVEKPFKLGVCESGCEFPTDIICYNNISRDLEKPGTKGCIAGWGSGSNFREGVYRRQSSGKDANVHIPENAKCLQEAKVCIMDNEACCKKWAQRFRNIISQYMICTKDVMKRISEICDKKYANCTDVETRRLIEEANYNADADSNNRIFNVDLGRHLRDPDDYTARRSSLQGGFCENDHGGPLIVRYQNKERVIGVISACKIDPKTHSCHGPFLYTSVFKNRQFLSCAINKDVEGGENCRRVFRTGITHEEWDVNWDGYKENDDDEHAAKADKDHDDNDSNEKLSLREHGASTLAAVQVAETTKTQEKTEEESSNSSDEEDETETPSVAAAAAVTATEKTDVVEEGDKKEVKKEMKTKKKKTKKHHKKKEEKVEKVQPTAAAANKMEEGVSGTQAQ
ncbi:uncharacterized protein LOC113232385 isoform X2 [Hyposmocoma kahamanoa]|uniref:uncharacterized protein LOC113232385 isoform X2 n=1 Tax=Hyposmocoma kahamanoa TaxID=1477025 RepID=UPI000E6D924D|nr:uncharacterized protein LOC113232385 isoform X2 [Hyposmocoma kahamanoa]